MVSVNTVSPERILRTGSLFKENKFEKEVGVKLICIGEILWPFVRPVALKNKRKRKNFIMDFLVMVDNISRKVAKKNTKGAKESLSFASLCAFA